MKKVLVGVLLVVVVVVGGFLYRSALERSNQPIPCPTPEFVCSDGTRLSHVGNSCDFPACPPPNVTVSPIALSFALPDGFASTTLPDATSVAAYIQQTTSTTTPGGSIVIREYSIMASSTALSTIQQTAIGGASGAPINPTSFTSTNIGTHRFTVVTIERFEGVIDTAYYLARNTDVLRFDAIDRGVDWTNQNLDITKLPAHAALLELLSTLQGE